MDIPQDIFQSSNKMIYSLYETPNLFQVVPPTNDTEMHMEVDTMIVGYTLLDDKKARNISNLLNPVILTFQSIRAQNKMVRFVKIYVILYI